MRYEDDAGWEPGDPPPERAVHLVVGATGRIGRALCARLVRDGARLVATGRDAGRLEDLAKETGAEALALDARRADELRCAARFALDRFGRLDGVAWLAAGALHLAAPCALDDTRQDRLASPPGAAFDLMRAAVSAFGPRGGVLALLAAPRSRASIAGHDADARMKAGVEALVRSAASTCAASAIRVNALAPGSPGLDRPEEIAAALAWLLGPESADVTGRVLELDGAFAALRARRGA